METVLIDSYKEISLKNSGSFEMFFNQVIKKDDLLIHNLIPSTRTKILSKLLEDLSLSEEDLDSFNKHMIESYKNQSEVDSLLEKELKKRKIKFLINENKDDYHLFDLSKENIGLLAKSKSLVSCFFNFNLIIDDF